MSVSEPYMIVSGNCQMIFVSSVDTYKKLSQICVGNYCDGFKDAFPEVFVMGPVHRVFPINFLYFIQRCPFQFVVKHCCNLTLAITCPQAVNAIIRSISEAGQVNGNVRRHGPCVSAGAASARAPPQRD